MRRHVTLLAALVLLLPVVANAQRGRDDRSERVARVIRDCEERTNEFQRAVERSWGRDTHSGDELDRATARLERSMNRIRETWNRDRDYRRTRGNVGAAIDAGKDINRILRHHRLGRHVEREWASIKSELNNLADVFEQPRIRW